MAPGLEPQAQGCWNLLLGEGEAVCGPHEKASEEPRALMDLHLPGGRPLPVEPQPLSFSHVHFAKARTVQTGGERPA